MEENKHHYNAQRHHDVDMHTQALETANHTDDPEPGDKDNDN